MRFLNCIRFLIVFLFALASYQSRAQACGSCTASVPKSDSLVFHVFNTDTFTYTLSSGQTLCIYNTAVFKGKVINNGGTICNQGRFFPRSFTFNSGSIINNKLMKINGTLSLSGSNSLVNATGSVLNITGGLSLSGGSLRNEGIINAGGTLTNSSGTLDNSAIINCNTLSGSNSVVYYPSGLINTKN